MNKIWNKTRQKKLLELRKLGKTPDEIRDYFTTAILQYHPNKLYLPSSYIITNYRNYITEIHTEPKKIDYELDVRYSMFYNNVRDYIINFNVDGQDYTLALLALKDKVMSYNILFTTKAQYDEYMNVIEDFLTDHNLTDLNDDMYNKFANILESETNLNKPFKIINALSYIIFDVYKKYLKSALFSIGSTDDKRKIQFYRNVIKNSFTNVVESEDIDLNNKKIFYYEIS